MREPLTIPGEDADHIEELLENLADGFYIDAPDEARQEQYEAMLERFRDGRY